MADKPLQRDVVCGMMVEPEKSEHTDYMGESYYFCCPDCKTEFEKDPGHHAEKNKICKSGSKK